MWFLNLYAVIENSLCKQLCLKLFPELSSVTHVIEVENLIEPVKVGAGGSPEWERLKRDNSVCLLCPRSYTFDKKRLHNRAH